MVTAGLVAATVVFFKYGDTGGKAMQWLAGNFNQLKDTAIATFGGIADALKAGDITLAGKILWAGLNVEFLTGSLAIKTIMADLSATVVESLRSVLFSIKGVMIEVFASIDIGLINIYGGFLKLGNKLLGFFEVIKASITNMFNQDAIDAELKKIRDKVTAQNAAVDQDSADAAGRVENNRGADQQALRDQQDAEAQARRAAARDSLGGSRAELAKAQAELDALNK